MTPTVASGQGTGTETEPVRTLHFGDSITYGLGDGVDDCLVPGRSIGYPARLATALAELGRPIDPVNAGKCGEETLMAIARIDGVLDDNPDARVFFLMEGTNDISGRVSVETISSNLREMAGRAAAQGLLPVYASVIPRGPNTPPDSNNARTSLLSETLREIAEEDDRLFVDAFGGMFDVPELFETFYGPDDGYHPNPRGYGLLADLFEPVALAALDRVDAIRPCEEGPEVLCLNEGRFRVEIDWTDFEGTEGRGQAERLTADTGTFWFFEPENVETIVKVLDGRCINDAFWVYYGALSDVEYEVTVTDTVGGTRRVYSNLSGEFASVGDTEAFLVPDEVEAACGGGAEAGLSGPPPPSRARFAGPSPGSAVGAHGHVPRDTSPCATDDRTLCLNEDRFEVRIDWRDFDGNTGTGRADPLTRDTGAFWFFEETNLEVVVKLLDGLSINEAFWVYYGALSNVEYRMIVRDTETGDVVVYSNPLGVFASGGDTEAFPQLSDGSE